MLTAWTWCDINARRGACLPVLLITANYSNELKLQVRELGQRSDAQAVKPHQAQAPPIISIY